MMNVMSGIRIVLTPFQGFNPDSCRGYGHRAMPYVVAGRPFGATRTQHLINNTTLVVVLV